VLSSDFIQLPSLAVICSVYNEEDAIPLFAARVLDVFRRLQRSYTPHLYFIDNGSSDRSLEIIRNLHERHPEIFVIVLSRNFGYQCALEAGLRTAEADLYVMIDVDCEDPPEMIEDFLKYEREGYEIVYGERTDRPEGILLKSARKLYYRVVRSVADDNFVIDMAEFSLTTREVRDAIIRDATAYPFLRASIGRIGFKRKNIPYCRRPRIAGKTHYNLLGMTVFAVGGVLSASTVILRWPAYAFPLWLLALGLIAIFSFTHPGTWQIPLILFIGFGFIGGYAIAIGLYVARIYKDGLRRPNAIVRYGLSILPPGND